MQPNEAFPMQEMLLDTPSETLGDESGRPKVGCPGYPEAGLDPGGTKFVVLKVMLGLLVIGLLSAATSIITLLIMMPDAPECCSSEESQYSSAVDDSIDSREGSQEREPIVMCSSDCIDRDEIWEETSLLIAAAISELATPQPTLTQGLTSMNISELVTADLLDSRLATMTTTVDERAFACREATQILSNQINRLATKDDLYTWLEVTEKKMEWKFDGDVKALNATAAANRAESAELRSMVDACHNSIVRLRRDVEALNDTITRGSTAPGVPEPTLPSVPDHQPSAEPTVSPSIAEETTAPTLSPSASPHQVLAPAASPSWPDMPCLACPADSDEEPEAGAGGRRLEPEAETRDELEPDTDSPDNWKAVHEAELDEITWTLARLEEELQEAATAESLLALEGRVNANERDVDEMKDALQMVQRLYVNLRHDSHIISRSTDWPTSEPTEQPSEDPTMAPSFEAWWGTTGKEPDDVPMNWTMSLVGENCTHACARYDRVCVDLSVRGSTWDQVASEAGLRAVYGALEGRRPYDCTGWSEGDEGGMYPYPRLYPGGDCYWTTSVSHGGKGEQCNASIKGWSRFCRCDPKTEQQYIHDAGLYYNDDR